MAPLEPTVEVEIVADSHIVERDRTHLTDAENALLKELLRPGAAIEAVIPDDAPAEKLWHALDACAKGAGILEARMLKLRPIIGRILQVFERKPSLYKSLGYETWSAFMKDGVYGTIGLHHSAGYQAQQVARDWKQVGPDRYARIGPKKLEILSKFTNGRASNAEDWLQRAEAMPVKEFKQFVEQRGFSQPGENDFASFTVDTTRAMVKFFGEFFNDGRVHSICGSKNRAKILEKLIQECHMEWIEKAEAQAEKKRRNGKCT